VPERTCIGCRRKRPVSELVRLVRLDDGNLAVGRTLAGRGAWLCRGEQDGPDERCTNAAQRRNAFSRALRATVNGAAVEALRANVAKRARMEERGD
jgi:predicted RNA-binding protein YlxR (DUF448 family)